MGYLMAIDAGTGSGRAVIFDEYGNQLGVGQKEWNHNGEEGVAGAMNFDTCGGWKLICDCIKEAVKNANIKASINIIVKKYTGSLAMFSLTLRYVNPVKLNIFTLLLLSYLC